LSQIRHQESKHLFATDTVTNIRIIVFALVSLAMMTLDHRHHYLNALRDTLSTLVYPVQYVIQLPIRTGRWLSENLATRAALLEENKQLRQNQLLINARLQKLTALEEENRRLRMLLGSSVSFQERVLISELLTVDFDPYRHQILLDKGARDGIRVGQPLLDQQGIIGQISQANTLTSNAILITDPNHSLPVQVNRNGLRTLAVGTGNFQELELPYVPNNEDIQVGDLLITSGLGGHFPRGYPVAKIARVEFDRGNPFARIIATPTAQLDRSREVLIIADDPEPENPSVGPLKQP
jgi:rod shape-determining protein MreC